MFYIMYYFDNNIKHKNNNMLFPQLVDCTEREPTIMKD